MMAESEPAKEEGPDTALDALAAAFLTVLEGMGVSPLSLSAMRVSTPLTIFHAVRLRFRPFTAAEMEPSRQMATSPATGASPALASVDCPPVSEGDTMSLNIMASALTVIVADLGAEEGDAAPLSW